MFYLIRQVNKLSFSVRTMNVMGKNYQFIYNSNEIHDEVLLLS